MEFRFDRFDMTIIPFRVFLERYLSVGTPIEMSPSISFLYLHSSFLFQVGAQSYTLFVAYFYQVHLVS